ncbi:hypothetical protein CTZ28_25240 [Streptomyces shenzhenensis]|uniref:Uncharacterized protein n=1 Tax=Streptomyces shenzhenensis TaxID=943815 RepID=A0A3M0I981_9ACTN|nr:hypothetical protein CTZ28_25240 [Streptomyces shenzhenensis]
MGLTQGIDLLLPVTDDQLQGVRAEEGQLACCAGNAAAESCGCVGVSLSALWLIVQPGMQVTVRC